MQPALTASKCPFQDRAPERQPVRGTLHKPPVLSRTQLAWLCLASLAVVLYGTLGPVSSAARPWIDLRADWSWVVPVDGTDFNDVVTNIAVYLPVGIAMRLLCRRRGRTGAVDFIAGLTAATALSYATELLQQFMPQRSPNILDVVTNAVGAAAGCAVAVDVQRGLRRLHAAAFECLHLRRDAWSVLTWTAVGVALAVLTMPWTLKHPQFTLGLGQPLSAADPHAAGRFILFATLGLLGAGRALLLSARPTTALAGTIWRVALFAEAVELGQGVLGEHVSSQLHVLVAVVGATTGAVVAVHAADSAPSGEATTSPAVRRRLRMLAFFALGLLIAISLVSEIGSTSGTLQLRPGAEFRWIPFRSHFHVAFTTALADVAQLYLKYAVLALVAFALCGGRNPGGALLLVAGTAGIVEIARTFLVGRPGDSTSLVVALIAWASMLRAWLALFPPPQPEHSR